MKEQTAQVIAIQKSLGLSEQDAWNVLIFIMGMNAGKGLQSTEKAQKESEIMAHLLPLRGTQ